MEDDTDEYESGHNVKAAACAVARTIQRPTRLLPGFENSA